jgi:hypothetical protein
MEKSSVKKIESMAFPWQTADPFLFCVHHEDFYPPGNEDLGPSVSLEGRNLGSDFMIKDGFRMYHGTKVPGFPAHPHRGFETVTIALEGFIDHSDSLGAAGRFGQGDVQWMTAGKGVQHCEMFPLLDRDQGNTLEIFQIWLNLPRRSKMAPAHFAMLWADQIPMYQFQDEANKTTEIRVIAGSLGEKEPPTPPPHSWAADPNNEVAIWNIRMETGSQWKIPVAQGEVNRRLYFYKGSSMKIDEKNLNLYQYASLDASIPTILQNGDREAHLLLLQGKPIAEPVAQHGPFVMNSEEEIRQAFYEYRMTQFGGWPWPEMDHVHPRERGRFARYADGTEVVKS